MLVVVTEPTFCSIGSGLAFCCCCTLLRTTSSYKWVVGNRHLLASMMSMDFACCREMQEDQVIELVAADRLGMMRWCGFRRTVDPSSSAPSSPTNTARDGMKRVSFQERVDMKSTDGTVECSSLKTATAVSVGLQSLDLDFGHCRITDSSSSDDEHQEHKMDERSSYKKLMSRSQLAYLKRTSI